MEALRLAEETIDGMGQGMAFGLFSIDLAGIDENLHIAMIGSDPADSAIIVKVGLSTGWLLRGPHNFPLAPDPYKTR